MSVEMHVRGELPTHVNPSATTHERHPSLGGVAPWCRVSGLEFRVWGARMRVSASDEGHPVSGCVWGG